MRGTPRRVRLRGLVPAVALVLAVGCDSRGPHSNSTPGDRPQGFVVINLSGLRADALGISGRSPSPSPFMDSLADGAQVYERAFSVSSDPLAAEVSLLSGLYPQEHRVAAPKMALSAEATVVAERFADFGYRTAAFTGGGYASSDFGIDRGFDDFTTLEPTPGGPDPTFSAAIEYLRQIGDQPFFVYLHSDALKGGHLASGSLGFERLAAGFEELTPELLERVRRSYEDEVRRLDGALEDFFEGLEMLGLRQRTAVFVTADRGFELGEHGRVGHLQVYPESLRVPLLLAVPGLEAGRFGGLVQTVDLAASLYRLAGIPAPVSSGRPLPGLAGAPGPRIWAAAETRGRWAQSSLFLETADGFYQLVQSHLSGEYDGTWVTRQVTLDTEAQVLDFSIVSYLVPRTISVRVDGHDHSVIDAGPKWAKARIELPPPNGAQGKQRRRVTLAADGCTSPSDSGSSIDRRCLSFKLEGLELSRTELFDLRVDPGATHDLSYDRPELMAKMATQLSRHLWLDTPLPETTQPGEAAMRRVLELGEYPEPSPR